MMKPHFPKQKKSTLAFFVTLLLVMLTLPANAQPSLLDPGTQVKFVNPLPIPAKIDVTKGANLRMQMDQTTQWLGLTNGSTSPMTTVWGYGPVGKPVTYPGPTFIAKKNVPVNVTWINNLPGHFLPVDASLHMAHPHGLTIPEVANWYAAGNVPTVAHLHGGHTESASDGLPEAWFTQNFRDKGQYFVKRKYTYHNDQEAATLWYHDHALGITRLNVYAGLAGFYLLEDKNERKLTADGVLPKREHDIEIVIQDRMFTTDGELYLPSKTGDPWFGDNFGNGFPIPDDNEPLDVGDIDPSVVAEFFGNFILVNGMTWPYLSVEPRPYRFRLLNGSDSRFYVLEFGPNGSPMNFLQIATDDGLLPNAVQLNQLIIAPGERAEVVVDFSGMEEDPPITLYNYGPDSPYKGSGSINSTPNPHTGEIMQFQVTKKLKVTRGLPIPTVAAGTVLRPALDPLSPTIYRKLALFEGEDADGRLQPLLGIINGDAAKKLLPP